MIYVSSSWRNKVYPRVLAGLREAGLHCYDFKNRESAFSWSQIDSTYTGGPVDPAVLQRWLQHPLAQRGFNADYQAMLSAIAAVLVLPSGRSSHMEAAWLAAMSRPLFYYSEEPIEPETAYLLGPRGVRTTLQPEPVIFYTELDQLVAAVRMYAVTR